MFKHVKDRLILALDVPDARAAERLVTETDGVVGIYKVGLEFVLAGGLEFARDLVSDGRQVFLDMKLLDIANTVAGAVRSAGRLGVSFLTVHAYPQAIAAAVAARPTGLSIVAVTVLTSLDDEDLAQAGYTMSSRALVERRIAEAASLGADAVVCAPSEAEAAHRAGLTVITPGVRLKSDSPDDQKRVATPQSAIAGGADAIVVGRPINAAQEPRVAAHAYVEAIEEGLAQRRAAARGAPSRRQALASSRRAH